MLRLLGRNTSNNVQKVLWLLEELGLQYTQEDFGGPFGKTRSQDYLALNPNGTVPTLIDREVVLWESNTILRYLADKATSPLYPVDRVRKAHVEKWLDWQLGTLSATFRPLYVGLVREGKSLTSLSEQHAKASALYRILDAELAHHPYIVGDTLTLADIALGPMVHRWYRLCLHSEETTHLCDFLQLLQIRTAFRKQVSAIELE